MRAVVIGYGSIGARHVGTGAKILQSVRVGAHDW